jgi:hypothetical protein
VKEKTAQNLQDQDQETIEMKGMEEMKEETYYLKTTTQTEGEAQLDFLLEVTKNIPELRL